MKKLSTYLFLILFSFHTSTLVADIRDFEISRFTSHNTIDGIAIGDSLLDYFSEKEIKDSIVTNPIIKSKKFTYVQISQNSKISDNKKELLAIIKYDEFDFWYKTNDKNYEIHSISGIIYYDKNIDDCSKKLDELDEEVPTIFKDAKRSIQDSAKHSADQSGESTIKQIYYDLKSGGGASFSCTDWSSKMDYSDYLIIIFDSKEFRQWWSFPGGCDYGSMCYYRY